MLPRLMRPVGSSDLMSSSPTSSTDDLVVSVLVCLCNLLRDRNIQKTVCSVGGGGNASAAPITITVCYTVILSPLPFPIIIVYSPFGLLK